MLSLLLVTFLTLGSSLLSFFVVLVTFLSYLNFFFFFEGYLLYRIWLFSVKLQHESATAIAAAKLLQSCPTLCDPIDGSPPGSPVPEILQARTLEWVAISFSNA